MVSVSCCQRGKASPWENGEGLPGVTGRRRGVGAKLEYLATAVMAHSYSVSHDRLQVTRERDTARKGSLDPGDRSTCSAQGKLWGYIPKGLLLAASSSLESIDRE